MIKIPKHLGRIAKRAGCIGVSGKVKTVKGGVCRFRSLLELKCIKLMESSKRVKSFRIEPFSIPYTVKAGNRVYKKKYKPDFLVEYNDGTRDVYEIKPVLQNKFRLNQIKWEHARRILQKSGVGFRIINDKLLKKII
jgi:hypothetical protein